MTKIIQVKSLAVDLANGLFMLKNSKTSSNDRWSYLTKSRNIFNLTKGLIIGLLLLVSGVGNVNGATRTAAFSGNWSSSNTWGGTVPVAGDDVVINSGITVTLDVNTPVILSLTIKAMNTSGTNGIVVGAYTLNTGTIAIAGSTRSGRYSTLSISTGIINVTGNISFTGAAAQARLIFSGAGTLNLGGNLSTGGTFSASNSTVNYNRAAAQTIGGYTYNNLTLSGSGVKTITTGTTVSGNLSISGATASIGTGLTITAKSLTLGGLSRINGMWGSTSSTATYQDNTYFAATTGMVNVSTDTRSLTPSFSGLTASPGICSGTATVTLSGSVSAAGPVYPANGETVGVTINGATQNATIAGGAGGFTINYPSAGLSAGIYTITYSYAGNTILQAAANNTSTSLTVNSTTTIISQSTNSQTKCAGVAFTPITVTATGTGLTYQWYSNTTASTTGGTSLGSANGAQTNSYTPQSTTVGTLYYYCIITGTCSTVTSAISGAFIVNSTTTISGQSTNAQTQCIGTAFTPITVTGTGTGLTYQWYSNTTASITGGTSLGSANGAQTNSYTPQSNIAGTLYYYCIVTGTCSTITSAISGAFIVNPTSTPTTTGAILCIGSNSTATLSASGAVTGQEYNWYNAATGGTLLKTSTDNTDNTYTTPVLTSTTNYWVSIMNAQGCEGSRTQVAATYPAASTDPQTPGTNSWIGYVYGGRDTNFANNTYFGHYPEPETFNESFGNGGDNYCFPITSNSTARSINTQNFSVRYLMNSTRKGLFAVDLGSDDGSRLTVDGTLLFNNWADQAFTSRPGVLMNLTGSSSLIYDFYENGGLNQVVFQNLTQLLANNLTANTSQSIPLGTKGSTISGDAFGTLPAGISLSGTGYQWTYSTTPTGTRVNIAGATGATFTPDATIAPFNVTGTYYIYRNAILSSINNVSPNPYVATNESNVCTLSVFNPVITTSVSTLTAFSYVVGYGPSVQQSFTVSGTSLNTDLTVTPSTNYEISTTSNSGFQSTPIILKQSGGSVANTTIYVRLKAGLVAGSYNSENIVTSSAYATSKNVTCSGTVNAPTITASVTSLTGFSYPVGYGPSGEQTFSVSGTNLTANISVTPSSSFEISTGSGASFVAANQITLTAAGGIVNATTIYVRMKAGLALGTVPAENIIVSTTGGSPKNVSCSGAVVTTPAITTSISTFQTTFSYTYTTGPSAQQSFTVSGSNLVANVLITPPADYEISTLSGSSFVATNPITLTPANGSINTTTIYARLKISLGVGNYNSENIVVSSNAATSKSITCNGTVNPAPTLTTNTSSLSTFIYSSGSGPSGSQSFILTGTNLGTAVVTVTPPTNFEIMDPTTGTYKTTAFTITPTGGSVNVTLNARLAAGLAINTYGPSNVSLSATGAVVKTVALSGSVVATTTPTILTSKTTLTGFGYMFGNGPSSEQMFTVSGASLGSSITIKPQTNFEISTSTGSAFSPTSTITCTPNNKKVVDPVTIYVRLKSGLNAGNYTKDSITLASGTIVKKVPCVGIVFVSPLITAGGGGTYCEGSIINLSSTGADIVNRYWQGPNSFYSTSQNPVLATSATPTMSGTYTVTGNVYVGGNLITNGDFESGNTSFGSSYNYVVPGKTINSNGNLWAESTYTVDANPNNSHANFSACPDHTIGGATPVGKQMIINGAALAGVVIWTQSVPVVPNASYEFSYWVQTVVATSPSQLQLYVNGVAAGPTYTADASTCTWKQFIYNTTAGPTTTTVNLELINKNTIADGNDFALDDIVFKQILPATSSVNVTVNPSLPVSVSITASANPIYARTPVTFTATAVNGGTSPSYQWKLVNSVSGKTNVGTNSATYTNSNLANGDSVYCVVTSNYPCSSGNPTTSNKIKMTVNQRTNYWMGSIDTDWGKAGNWTANYVPLAGDDVEYATTSNFTSVAKNDLYLDADRTIGNLINASTKRLVIPAGKGLVVNSAISLTPANNPYLIYISSSSTLPNGSLIFHNSPSVSVYGTVEMYSPAFYNPSGPAGYKYKWQYFGIPVSIAKATPTFDGSYVRSWDERQDTLKHWVALTNDSVLRPFYGYELTQQSAKTIYFQGQLVNSDFNIGPLAVSPPPAAFPGQHIFANPYTAAINIKNLTFGSDTEATVYLYNTGSYADWSSTRGSNTLNGYPGQYTAVPQNTAGSNSLQLDVPSMQAILIRPKPNISTYNNFTFGISYNSVIMENATRQRVSPEKTLSTNDDNTETLIEVKGTNFSDRMWIFSQPGCTHHFDNGWDGAKLMGSALTPQLYAVESDGNYQVDAVDDMNNTKLGFQAGEDVEYTMTFTHQNIKSKYAGVYLMDNVENKTVDITESGSTYSFLAESTFKAVNRFNIITRPYEQSSPDKDSQIKIFSSRGCILVQNFSSLSGHVMIYDIAGHYLKKVALAPNGGIVVVSRILPGAYIAKAITNQEGVAKRLIVQ
ncbi:MAG: G8 domain-containing protein [Bacteroidota bacterium]|nr:G8 domain-containing protein [Bacteroidota bacterium]